MHSVLKVVLFVLISGLFLASCESDTVSEGGLAATQNTEAHYFTNREGEDVEVNDLHVVFEQADISVLDLGPFNKSTAKDVGEGTEKHSEVDFSGFAVAVDSRTKVSFQSGKHDNFLVDKWWWTNDGEQVGDIKHGNPD